MKKDSYYYYSFEGIKSAYCDDTLFVFFSNYNIGIHKHDFFEINFITSGKGIHYFAGNEFEVSKGDVFVVPIDTEHAYKSIDNLNVSHLVLSNVFFEKNKTFFLNNKEYISLFLLEPQFKQLAGFNVSTSLKLNDAQLNKINTLLNEIDNQQYVNCKETNNIIFGLVLSVLFYIFRLYRENNNDELKIPSKFYSMNSIISSIYSSNPYDVHIEKLANVSGYSKANFYRVFKKTMKCTPGQYIIRYKIDKAKKLLANTELTIKEIANECGFYDSAHFVRCFKNFEKITPIQYRKSNS